MTVPQTPFTNDTMSKPQLSPLELGQLIGLKEDGSAITAVCTWRELAWAINRLEHHWRTYKGTIEGHKPALAAFCLQQKQKYIHAFLERFDTSLLRTLAVAQAIIAQDQRSCTAQLARVTQDLLTWAIDGLPDVPVRLVQEHPKLMRQFYERVAEQLANEPHSPGLDFDPDYEYPNIYEFDHRIVVTLAGTLVDLAPALYCHLPPRLKFPVLLKASRLKISKLDKLLVPGDGRWFSDCNFFLGRRNPNQCRNVLGAIVSKNLSLAAQASLQDSVDQSAPGWYCDLAVRKATQPEKYLPSQDEEEGEKELPACGRCAPMLYYVYWVKPQTFCFSRI